MSDPTRAPLPPDPEQYDAPRSVAARKRGLEAPYIAGGNDPGLPASARTERRYIRLLVAMVLAIVGLGITLAVLSLLVSPATP